MVQGVVVEDGCIVDVNPSTGALIAKVPCSTAAEVDRAVVAARTAQPTWQECGLPQRHELIAGALLKLKDRQGGLDGLAELISLEMGKVLREAKDEVAGAVDKDHFLKLVRAANEDELIDEATGTTMVRDPHGVVAVISPWNFPADEILLLALPALMAGNTVIVKPSEVAPLTGAARNLPPDRSTASPTLTPVRSSTVLQSTYVLALAFDPRDAIPATALSGPPTATASAALGSASIAKTTSHVDVTSAGVRATAAPSARKGSVFATLLLYTVMFAPAPTSLDAICAPMMPRPRKPTRGWEDMA